MDALQLFDAMLRDRIAPALRALGMRGSGQRFSLPNPAGDYALLGFQKDSHNTPESCRFTASTAFCHRVGWEQARALHTWLPAAPTATTFYPFAPVWQMRVGLLLDPPYDRWWTIQTASDVSAVTDEVLAAVKDAVLPQLRARLTLTEPPPVPERNDPPVAQADDVDRGSALDAAYRAALAAAIGAVVPRTRAWKVLHISRGRLDSYADRIGAGPDLRFVELLSVSMLAYDEVLDPAHWPRAAAAVAGWAAQLPEAAADAALVVSEQQAVVLPFGAALTLDDTAFGSTVIHSLIDATRHLLRELSASGNSTAPRA